MTDDFKELTFNIYVISRCTHNYYARELRKIGITMGQFPFLMKITEQDGISQEQLSQKLRISKSTTAVIVRQLLAARLVVREIDPRDRRNYRLHAAEKAFALIPEIESIIERCHKIICSEIPPSDRRKFARLTAGIRRRSENDLPPSESTGK